MIYGFAAASLNAMARQTPNSIFSLPTLVNRVTAFRSEPPKKKVEQWKNRFRFSTTYTKKTIYLSAQTGSEVIRLIPPLLNFPAALSTITCMLGVYGS